ncbi:MAG: hypothetical protein LBH57_00930, partial [Treponema sp.]|nr:hypothetical protein [Treponema sp.]
MFRDRGGVDALQAHSPPETPQSRTESLTLLIRSLNLPPDSLSAALVSFARHFSLPLQPALLTKLRREVLSLKTPGESAALAAAAVADKGVELTPAALERYAAAIDPDARRRQTGGQGRKGDCRGQGGLAPESSGADQAGDASGGVSLPAMPDAEGLRKMRDDLDGQDPLLSLLNRIPGRDGERWMVYPFQVTAGGKRFQVSIRVAAGCGKEDVRLAVDVAGEERRWLFVATRPVPHPQKRRGAEAVISPELQISPEIRSSPEIQVSLWPPPGRREREVLEREIREALGPFGGRVSLRDGEPLLA